MSESPGIGRRLRSAAGPLAKTGLLILGGYSMIRRLAPSRRIAILRYHAVCGDEGTAYAEREICVPPDDFERHARYLAAHYAVLPLPEIAARLRTGRPLPANTVALTFDDGYADNLPAARVLARYGISATFYITAGCLHGEAPFWPSEIRYLMAAAPLRDITLNLPGRSVTLPLSTEADRPRAIRALSRLCKSSTIPARDAFRAQLRDAVGHPELPKHMLTWEELAEMHRLGMTIGAHTYSHANLPSAGLGDATGEIIRSRDRLRRELGTEITMFSYPNGGAERYFTPELQRVVADTGFAAATTSRNAFATRESDLYGLERIQVADRLEDLIFALEVERFVFTPVTTDNTPAAITGGAQ
jgi:peptidoglycan/xylan/chitin deacetylase (PgdA/CDA1 family)